MKLLTCMLQIWVSLNLYHILRRLKIDLQNVESSYLHIKKNGIFSDHFCINLLILFYSVSVRKSALKMYSSSKTLYK